MWSGCSAVIQWCCTVNQSPEPGAKLLAVAMGYANSTLKRGNGLVSAGRMVIPLCQIHLQYVSCQFGLGVFCFLFCGF